MLQSCQFIQHLLKVYSRHFVFNGIVNNGRRLRIIQLSSSAYEDSKLVIMVNTKYLYMDGKVLFPEDAKSLDINTCMHISRNLGRGVTE